MKLTKTKLKQIIKEEISVITEAGTSPGNWPGGPKSFHAWVSLVEAIAADTGKDTYDVGFELAEFIKSTFYNYESGQEELEEKKKPSETSLKKAHKSLEKTAKKKFPRDKEHQNKYVYGAKRKMGWKPEREK